MKKIFAALLVLALVAPAFAVSFSAADLGGGKLQISYDVPTGEVLRGVALKLNTTAGTATIADTAAAVVPSQALDLGFNTFVDYAFSTPTGYDVKVGHPLAKVSTPGVLDTFPASEFVLSMGVLDQTGGKGGVTGTGVLCEIQYAVTGTSATIEISADPVRGGAVVGDAVTQPTLPITQDLVPVVTETVSPAPAVPTGPAIGYVGTGVSFTTTGGSVSNLGHAVQYGFDWGDSTAVTWGAATQSHSYAAVGNYTVKVQARCAEHTDVVSDWSGNSTAISIKPACWGYACFANGDGNGDNGISYGDLLLLINSWPPKAYDPCADFNKDGGISYGDLLIVINHWPPNPGC